jgi:hypothetical protein
MQRIRQEADIGGVIAPLSRTPCPKVWREIVRCHLHLVELHQHSVQPRFVRQLMRQLQQAEEPTSQLRMRSICLQLPERGVVVPGYRADGAFSEAEFSGQPEAARATDAHSRKIAFDLLEVLLHPGGRGLLALFWAERPAHRPEQRATSNGESPQGSELVHPGRQFGLGEQGRNFSRQGSPHLDDGLDRAVL